MDGPDVWQRDILDLIGTKLRRDAPPLWVSVASGHGIGKSALVSWVVLWALATMQDTRVVVTANTEAQLRTKTWPEIAKWHSMSLVRDMFTFTATALSSSEKGREKNWFADAATWSETNTEAFAGLHNQGKRIVLIMDEASAIADIVWEVAEGAMTDKDTEILWLAFGNPTKPVGRFRECFAGGRFAHRWEHRQIDSRTVAMTNKEQLNQWVADYGEDSDFVRVRVRGVFPKTGAVQFIGSDLVAEAAKREASGTLYDPLILGVDVARFGDDSSVIAYRRGRDARSIPMREFRGLDTMQFAAMVAEEINTRKPQAVFVDEGGVGGGVIDRLRQLGHVVIGVNFGSASSETRIYANKRAEMWGRMRDWLAGGAIQDSADLVAELTGPEYSYDKDSRIVLEKKADMKKRGLSSPDHADALALTFAHPVAATDQPLGRYAKAEIDFDPYAD